MTYMNDYTRTGDLEVEGKIQLDDESVAACLCSAADAVFTAGRSPSAAEFAACAALVNELKEKLNALVGALT